MSSFAGDLRSMIMQSWLSGEMKFRRLEVNQLRMLIRNWPSHEVDDNTTSRMEPR